MFLFSLQVSGSLYDTHVFFICMLFNFGPKQSVSKNTYIEVWLFKLFRGLKKSVADWNVCDKAWPLKKLFYPVRSITKEPNLPILNSLFLAKIN